MTDVAKTLEERGTRYGVFTDHARVTQRLKLVIASELNIRSKDLEHDQQEALDMICHKIGRIVNGDPNYIDSWTDIIGYTRLVEKRLIAEQKTGTAFAFGAQCQEEVPDPLEQAVSDALKKIFGPDIEVHHVRG